MTPSNLDIRVVILFNFQLPIFKEQSALLTWVLEKTVNARVRFHLALAGYLLRKEVIQPLVPQRLPCYDFIPITTHTLGGQMPDFGCRRLS